LVRENRARWTSTLHSSAIVTHTHSELSHLSSSAAGAQPAAELAYRHFAEILAVCHTVVVEKSGDGTSDGERTGSEDGGQGSRRRLAYQVGVS